VTLPAPIRSTALAGVPHGFLGREGGVSTGVVAGLNVGLGTGDDPAAVAENRRRAVAAVRPGARLVTLYQVHSADAVIVDAPFVDDARPRADAIVSDRPDLLLGILTADCAPVLLADVAASVVGAAHAGWRGAAGGVIEATVARMADLGADPARITAAIGPCIAQASYEVDADFRANLLALGHDADRFFAAGEAPDRHQFDLEAYVAARLAAAGVRTIDRLSLDTYSTPARFFSYRRATHRGEADYGRQIALIGAQGVSTPT